jgi:hypothetical protein
MSNLLRRAALVSCLTLATGAFAEDAPPSVEELKKLLDYQENGKDRGPVLLDVVACAKVDQTKGSATQLNEAASRQM